MIQRTDLDKECIKKREEMLDSGGRQKGDYLNVLSLNFSLV